MKWTRLRSALKERLAPALSKRVALHQARYRNTLEEAGRVWITLDGREIISFDTTKYVARRAELEHDIRSGIGPLGLSSASNYAEYLSADDAARALLRESGQYDDYSALADLETYLSLAIEDALVSPSPLHRALAIVDRRVGKRRLRALGSMAQDQPFILALYTARCAAEGVGLEQRVV